MNREKSQKELNLATLRRIDTAIIDVLANSAHVAVYNFEDSTKSWTRRDVEGSLFVVKRSEEPHYRLLVLNRLSTENLMEDVTSTLLVQLSGPYMIYRNHFGVTTGIWFYEESEKEKISGILRSVQEDLVRQSSAPPAQLPQEVSAASLMGLLNSIKDQSQGAPNPSPYPQPHQAYPPEPYGAPPHNPSYPPHFPPQNPPPHSPYHAQPPPQHYPHPPPPAFSKPPAHVPSPYDVPPGHPHPPPQYPHPPPGYPPHPQPSAPQQQSSQANDIIANLISNLAQQHVSQNPPPSSGNYPPQPPLHHSASLPNLYGTQPPNPNYPPQATPGQPASQNPNSPKPPPKAFFYDANSPTPKLLSPSNVAAKILLPPHTSLPSLNQASSSPLMNPQSGIPGGPAVSPPIPSTNNLNGSTGSTGSSGGLGGSGGVKISKQQLRQAIHNLANDDRFIDIVYNEYMAASQR